VSAIRSMRSFFVVVAIRGPLYTGRLYVMPVRPSLQTLGIWNGDQQRPTKNQHPHAGTARPIHLVLNEYRKVSAGVSSLHIGLPQTSPHLEIRFTA
jgi:hypothetical protein